MGKASKPKSKPLDVSEWTRLVVPGAPAQLQNVLEDESRCDDLLVQLAAGFRGNGALITGSPALRLAVLQMFERHCAALCQGATTNRVRVVYETLRDHLGCPARDGPQAAAQLRDAALRSLTQVLIDIDAPRRDPRLVKFHVEALFRLLEGAVGSTDVAAANGLVEPRRQLAVECLGTLESAFPTLLYAEAGALLHLAAKESTSPARGLLVTQLSLQASSNASALYLRQAAAAKNAQAASAAEYAMEDSDSGGESMSADEEGGLTQAAAGLGDGVPAEVLCLGIKEDGIPETPSCTMEQPFASTRTDTDDVASTGCSTPTTATSSCATGTGAAAAAGSSAADLRRSALTAALRASSSESSMLGLEGMGTGASTPRAPVTEAPLLSPPAAGTALRRFNVPAHLQSGEESDAPRLLLTPEVQLQMQHAVRTYLVAMRRLAPAAVAAMVTALPPVLRCARPASSQLWPHIERLMITGSTPLLRAVLDLHDEVPELFDGRGLALLEKVLGQVNDPALSVDHRVAAVSWVMRQHAEQRHSGGALLLADCWEQLLPLPREPPQLVALKVKALSACLAAGVGDEDVVCRAVCGWDGFGGVRPSERQLRALTYALRMLHGGQKAAAAPPGDEPHAPSLHRLHACLVTSALEMLANRPQLTPAVDAFVETSPPPFAATFLRAFNALLSSVDGQFEALRERQEDAAFAGTGADLAQRVKAAVLSRSSSLAGLMRGLSFSLSFTKRTHSVTPLPSARGDGPQRGAFGRALAPVNERARRPVDVSALRSSISAAFESNGQRGAVQGAAAALSGGSPPSAANSIGGDDAAAGERVDGDADEVGAAPAAAPAVPHDLKDWPAAEAWLAAAATWEGLAPGLLRHDLMAYRVLMQRALRSPEVHPRGILQTLANYTWQYKEAHPTHELPAKQTAAAILALCHTAALTHLPYSAPASGGSAKGKANSIAALHGSALVEGNGGWGLRRAELADSVQSVLDALEEGFPVPQVRARSQILGSLLSDEAAWGAERSATVLGKLVCGYIDTAVEGAGNGWIP